MTTILHLSDLHLLGEREEQEQILPSLIAAVEGERRSRARRFDLVVVTGDVFDTSTTRPSDAVREFEALRGAIEHALGGPVPTIVVPGNHDRRRIGLFGPHRSALFDALRDRAPAHVVIHGCDTPFLARLVPHEMHGQPMHVIAYDSTYLPSGALSAGGIVRQEDLLAAAAEIGDREPDWPVLFLLHHHLVPTPLTDLGPIETHRTHPLVNFALHRVLPILVAHADREELTMTALGAGTALSTLHLLQRAVVVLHGHKHYATARKLAATEADQGDVLLASAGSAGTAQRWSPISPFDTARLWPSFNVIELERESITIECVAFGWKGRSAGRIAHRPLVWAARDGARWAVEPVRGGEAPSGPILKTNEARVRLAPSRAFGGARWDADYDRRLERLGRGPRRYVESAIGLPGAAFERGGNRSATPAQIELSFDPSAPTRFRIDGGLCRTLAEATKLFGPATAPYEWTGLMNRYHAKTARLVVEGLGAATKGAFASATDLGTGRERPLSCTRDPGGDRVVVQVSDCAPRTLLRVYWPLEGR